MLILKDEHAIDVLKSGNTGHLWHDFHAIGVHATDVGHPNGDDQRHVLMKCLSLQFAHASSRLSISMGNQFSTDYSVGPIIMIPTGDHHEILIQLNCIKARRSI